MIEYVVYDASDQFRAQIVPNWVNTTLLANEVSFHELTFDANNKAWDDLGPGARVAALWDGVEISRGWFGGFDRRPDHLPQTVYVFDDWKDFRRLFAWAKPSAAINLQTDEYKRYTGKTETVIKNVCADLNSRMSLGWTIPATAGLGVDERVEARFDNLVDLLSALATAQDLLWTLRNGVVDVKLGDLFGSVLTEKSGVLGDYVATLREPTVTRPIVAGENEGGSRVLRQYIDAAREAEWGFKAEGWVNARLAKTITDFQSDADVALSEGAAQVQVTSELNEIPGLFTFGTGSNQYKVGDRVNIRIGDYVDTTQMIRKVVITGDPSNGVRVVPSIGDLATDTTTRLGRQVSKLARSTRALERR